MQESRKQFIEFAKKEGLSLQTGYSGYVNLNTQLTLRAWDMAWQASRAAIEIELPVTTDVHPLGPSAAKMFCELHKNTVSECAKSIRAAGLKIKGE